MTSSRLCATGEHGRYACEYPGLCLNRARLRRYYRALRLFHTVRYGNAMIHYGQILVLMRKDLTYE